MARRVRARRRPRARAEARARCRSSAGSGCSRSGSWPARCRRAGAAGGRVATLGAVAPASWCRSGSRSPTSRRTASSRRPAGRTSRRPSQATGIAGRPFSRLTEGGSGPAPGGPSRWRSRAVGVSVGAQARAATGCELGLLLWLGARDPGVPVQHWWIYTTRCSWCRSGSSPGYGLEAIVDAWPPRTTALRVAVVVGAVVLLLPAAARFGAQRRARRRATTSRSRPRTGPQLRYDLESDYGPAEAWAAYLARPRHAATAASTCSATRSTSTWPTAPRRSPSRAGRPSSTRRACGTGSGASSRTPSRSTWSSTPSAIAIMRSKFSRDARLIAAWYSPVGRAGPDRWYRLKTSRRAVALPVSGRPTG